MLLKAMLLPVVILLAETTSVFARNYITPYHLDYQEVVLSNPYDASVIGGPTGVYKSMYVEDAAVRRITIFESSTSDKRFLKGVQLEFTNGERLQRGGESTASKSFIFEEGETLQGDLEICGNNEGGVDTRAGYLHFKTTMGNEFSAGSSINRAIIRFPVDKRVLMGVIGRFGEDIDALGVIVSRRITSSKLLDVKYDNPPLDEEPIDGAHIKKLHGFSIENNATTAVDKKITFLSIKESTLTHTSTKTQHLQTNVKVKTEFEGDVLVVKTKVSGAVDFEYGYQWTNSDTESQKDTEEVMDETTITVPGYSRLAVRVYQVAEVMDITFSGWLHTEYEGGGSSETLISGKLEGVLVSSSHVDVGIEEYFGPTGSPTANPTEKPTRYPSMIPSKSPTGPPSEIPSDDPSIIPSMVPTTIPADSSITRINQDQPSPGTTSNSAVVITGNVLHIIIVSATIVLFL